MSRQRDAVAVGLQGMPVVPMLRATARVDEDLGKTSLRVFVSDGGDKNGTAHALIPPLEEFG
jgi:hypothetical protein